MAKATVTEALKESFSAAVAITVFVFAFSKAKEIVDYCYGFLGHPSVYDLVATTTCIQIVSVFGVFFVLFDVYRRNKKRHDNDNSNAESK